MTTNRGEPLSYKVDGSVKDAVYTVTLSDRSDGKKGCVWSGHNSKTWHGLAGKAHCDGNVGLVIRASSQ